MAEGYDDEALLRYIEAAVADEVLRYIEATSSPYPLEYNLRWLPEVYQQEMDRIREMEIIRITNSHGWV